VLAACQVCVSATCLGRSPKVAAQNICKRKISDKFLTNAKQNEKLEQTETAKKYKYRKNAHTNQIKTRTFCTLVKIL